MRISTQEYYNRSINVMLEQQSALSQIQNQVASGKRVNTPADDPIAAVHILELERTKTESEQFGKNSDLARSRLSLEEQGLADAGSLMQRVRELVVQASNTGTLSDNDRKSIASELSARLDELEALSNRKDSNGEYLFSGFSTLTQPFVVDGTGAVQYAGDQGNRQLQVGPTQRVADGHSGFDVFMDIPSGNGTFATGAAAANTGSGIIDAGSVSNVGAWVPDNYTLTFTTPTSWAVTDSLGNSVATGAYTSGRSIAFRGVQVTVTGAPAAGDTFAVKKSTSQDAFTTLRGIVSALNTPATTPALKAQLSSTLSASLQQIDQTTDHFLGVRATVGARLSSLDNADDSRAALNVDIETSLSGLRDLDYASALSKMQQQVVGLQAAQLSYSKISQLSLFNYLS